MENNGLAPQLTYEQQRAAAQSEILRLLSDDDHAERRRRESEQQNLEILTEFFTEPLANGAIKQVRGAHIPRFNEYLQRAYQKVQEFDSRLGMDCFADSVYRSPQTTGIIQFYSGQRKDAFESLLLEYRTGLNEIAGKLASDTIDFQLPRELLTVPAYASQVGDAAGFRECFNACFRMVFNSLTDLDVSQHQVRMAMNTSCNTGVVDDEEYLKVFTNPKFAEMTDRTCKVVTFTGTDLGVLGRTAQSIKEKRPDAQIYSMVSFLSDGALMLKTPMVWHTGILLHANDKHVVIHDPAEKVGHPEKQMTKSEFLRRWGAAFNRAHLIIAA